MAAASSASRCPLRPASTSARHAETEFTLGTIFINLATMTPTYASSLCVTPAARIPSGIPEQDRFEDAPEHLGHPSIWPWPRPPDLRGHLLGNLRKHLQIATSSLYSGFDSDNSIVSDTALTKFPSDTRSHSRLSYYHPNSSQEQLDNALVRFGHHLDATLLQHSFSAVFIHIIQISFTLSS